MIIGEDTITVDRKNRAEWEGKMSARMMMLANKPPKFSDASGAIVGRWITVKFTESFEGREDETLEAKLTAELPGIFNWALEGLKRLTERGRFVQPESGMETIRTQRENASPVKTFVEERAVRGEGHWVVKASLFEAWKAWCTANNVQAVGTTAQFATDLYAAFPGIEDGKQKRIAGTAMRCFSGITLKTPSGMCTPATQSAAPQE
jgi:putative DNA primase/helicase